MLINDIIRLQADGAANGSDPIETPEEVEDTLTENEENEVKPEGTEETLTKEEAQEWIEEVVQKRVARENRKHQKELDDLKKQYEQEKKKAKMNAEEKAQFEIEEKEKEIREREQAVQLRELTATAKTKLADEGYSTDLSDLLKYETEETMEDSLELLTSYITNEVQRLTEEAVQDRLKGTKPPKGGTKPTIKSTGFEKLSEKYKK